MKLATIQRRASGIVELDAAQDAPRPIAGDEHPSAADMRRPTAAAMD
jgi:hypothetical protein